MMKKLKKIPSAFAWILKPKKNYGNKQVIEKVFKKLKMEKSISKDAKISDKTYLTGTSSPLIHCLCTIY